MSLICKHRHQITSNTRHANFVIGNEKLTRRMGNLGNMFYDDILRKMINDIKYSFQQYRRDYTYYALMENIKIYANIIFHQFQIEFNIKI